MKITTKTKRTVIKGTIGFIGGVVTGACFRLAYETAGAPDKDFTERALCSFKQKEMISPLWIWPYYFI